MAKFAELNPAPVLRVSPDGEILFTNHGALIVLGAHATAGASLCDVMPNLDVTLLASCASQDRTAVFEYMVNDRVFEFDIQPVAALAALHLYGRDVTEPRRLSRELAVSRRMEAIGRLASGIAHDFNNLLGVVAAECSILAKAMSDDDPLARDVQNLELVWQRGASLTRQLLEFGSQSPRQTLPALSLDVVVFEMVPLLQRLIGEDITFATSLGATEAIATADRTQIEQIVMNLVVNARDAMPRGGSLHIETARISSDTCAAGDTLLLTVRDTGLGMDEETLSRLFEPFYTTKPAGRGTGLGLSTVYGIVTQHGGTVTVDSCLGGGAAFHVRLPAARVSAAAQATYSAPHELATEFGARERPPRVLLVEDDPQVRSALLHLLESIGCQAVATGSASDALAGFDGAAVDIVVTDVIMPEMSGVELVERLVKISPGLRVLFTSGYGDAKLERAGMPSGSYRFLAKPFSEETLRRQIIELIPQSKSS